MVRGELRHRQAERNRQGLASGDPLPLELREGEEQPWQGCLGSYSWRDVPRAAELAQGGSREEGPHHFVSCPSFPTGLAASSKKAGQPARAEAGQRRWGPDPWRQGPAQRPNPSSLDYRFQLQETSQQIGN